MKLRKYIPIIIMLCLVAGAAVLMLAGDGVTVEMLTSYAPKNTFVAVLVALAAYAIKSQTVFVLYGVVATAVGIVFEPPLSLIVNALGSVICISVPYFTGRASGGDAARKLLNKYKRLGEVYEDNRGNLFLVSLVLRVTNLSNDILGLFFGALGMNFWQYLASSFIGILPTMVLYTVLGNDLDPTSTPVMICLGVDLACIAAAWIVLRLRKKRKGKQNEEKAL